MIRSSAPVAITRTHTHTRRQLNGWLLASTLLIVAMPALAGTPPKFRKVGEAVAGEYIVVLEKEHAPALESLAQQLPVTVSGVLVRTYGPSFPAFFVRMSEPQARALSNHPAVAWVEENAVIHISAFVEEQLGGDEGKWHLDRIDQVDRPLDGKYVYRTSGEQVQVYVFDSGIRADHVEFGGRVGTGYDAVRENDAKGQPCDQRNPCLFHGTAVASMIGGNTLGVARSAILHPYKVISRAQTGTADYLNEAVSWLLAGDSQNPGPKYDPQKPRVANFSFWANAAETLITERIQQLIDHGFVVVTSANNHGGNFCDSQIPAGMGAGAVITQNGTPGA